MRHAYQIGSEFVPLCSALLGLKVMLGSYLVELGGKGVNLLKMICGCGNQWPEYNGFMCQRSWTFGSTPGVNHFEYISYNQRSIMNVAYDVPNATVPPYSMYNSLHIWHFTHVSQTTPTFVAVALYSVRIICRGDGTLCFAGLQHTDHTGVISQIRKSDPSNAWIMCDVYARPFYQTTLYSVEVNGRGTLWIGDSQILYTGTKLYPIPIIPVLELPTVWTIYGIRDAPLDFQGG